MSKNGKVQKEEVAINETSLASPKGKTVEELKEIAQTLQTQFNESQKLASHHSTVATKAQGALEVILQLIPKQEIEEMIGREPTNNHQEMATSDG